MLTAGCWLWPLLTLPVQRAGWGPSYKPKRINKMIELLEAGQPYTTSAWKASGMRKGKSWPRIGTISSSTRWSMGFEPTCCVSSCRDSWMADHKERPSDSDRDRHPAGAGADEQTVKNNHWVIEQILSAGVHGMMLCHARMRRPSGCSWRPRDISSSGPNLKGADKGLPEGLRGRQSGICLANLGHLRDGIHRPGRSVADESQRRDHPVAEDGRQYSLANIDADTKVPGVAWGEWGPGDQAMSLMGLEISNAAAARVAARPVRSQRVDYRPSVNQSWMRHGRKSWMR